MVERLLDRLDASGRFALLKLVTGGLRVGVSARLAKQALADLGGRDVAEIEEVWHGLAPPYAALFAWLDGGGAAPGSGRRRAVPPGDARRTRSRTADLDRLDPADFAAEWKWDGIRVQAVAEGGAPPALLAAPATTSPAPSPTSSRRSTSTRAIDGELLVRAPRPAASPASPTCSSG